MGIPARLLFAAALLLAAPASARPPGGITAGPPPAAEPELPAADLLIRYESPSLRFRWSVAPEAALEPKLVAELRQQALADRQEQIDLAKESAAPDIAAAAAGERRAPPRHEWREQWRAEAETDLLLALSARQDAFTGGAHGMVHMRAILWDRGAGRKIAFADLFADPEAAIATLRPPFCRALDEERRTRRTEPGSAIFSGCPDIAAYPVVPVGEGRITALRVLIPPYEAGPWSEGVYEILLDAAPLARFAAPRYLALFTAP